MSLVNKIRCEMEIQNTYYCRQQHILFLRDYSKIIDDHIFCEMCNDRVTAPYYVCNSCKYYVHELCAKLPKQINLSFHPGHPLILFARRSFRCHSCQENFMNSFVFSCVKCNFELDVECALMSNTTTKCPESQEHSNNIQHSSHPHLLLRVDLENNKDKEIECFACKPKSSAGDGGVYYGCNRCKYYLHEQCINNHSTQEIQSPIHPHLLSLRPILFDYTFRCSNCGKECGKNFYFECTECGYKLCLHCGAKQLRIPFNYEGEEHYLYFEEKKYSELGQCDAYDCHHNLSVNSNSNKFEDATTSIFHCWKCEFQLHLLCSPLPCTIKHEYHIHPLTLVDSFIEDYSGEYYCNICESNRDPRLRVYRCDQCNYVAHVHCLISEIINVLKGDFRGLKLKTVGEDLWKLPEEIGNTGVQKREQERSLSTLRDLIPKLTKYEVDLLRDHFYWDEDNNREQEASQRTTQLEQIIDDVLEFSSFDESRFNSYKIDSGFRRRKLIINSSDLALKMVNVKGHWIPFTLASVLNYLLDKHGEISKESRRSPEMKSILYFFLCQVIKKMHSILVVDITIDLLRDWYYYMEFAKLLANFGDFLEQPLKDITGAVFYLQVSKLDVEVPTILQNEIEEYEAKIEEYKAKIADCNAKLEKSKKLRKSSLQQEFMKKGLNKLMKLKWKTAREFCFDDSCLD